MCCQHQNRMPEKGYNADKTNKYIEQKQTEIMLDINLFSLF